MHANMDRLRDSGTVFQVVDLWASSLLFICTQRSRGRDKSRHACSICYSNDAQKGGSIRALYYCASTLNITGQSYKGNMEASSCMPAMIKQTYMHACFRIRIKSTHEIPLSSVSLKIFCSDAQTFCNMHTLLSSVRS
jgi:hypothetical protein